MKPAALLRLILLFGLLLSVAACRQEQKLSASDIQLDLTVSDLLVGETTLLLAVTDKEGKAIAEPGALALRGDMDHAGMSPVLAESETAANGKFTVPFEWTMGGSWTVDATLTLPGGAVAKQTFRYEVISEADDDMADMSMPETDDEAAESPAAEAPGSNSAAYMRVTNRGAEDFVFVSAETAAAQSVEFHQTSVVDDVASMQRVDELVAPAGGELKLEPGGLHFMLLNLTQDLKLRHNFVLELKDSAGAVYRLSLRVLEPPRSDLVDSVYLADGNLIFSNLWANPASAG